MRLENLIHREKKLVVLQGCEAEVRWLQLGIFFFSPHSSFLKVLQSIPCSRDLQWDLHGAAGLGISAKAFWHKKKVLGIN